MPTKVVKTGDILLYTHLFNSPDWGAIKLGEELEDGKQRKEYIHVGVALNSRELITADGTVVAAHPINFNDEFDVYTLTDDRDKIHAALSATQKHLGEKYDWWEIIDQGIRDLTGGRVHLPRGFIMTQEHHKKICSTVAKVYIDALSLGIEIKEFPSPEDIYIAIAKYLGLLANEGEEVSSSEVSDPQKGKDEGTQVKDGDTTQEKAVNDSATTEEASSAPSKSKAKGKAKATTDTEGTEGSVPTESSASFVDEVHTNESISEAETNSEVQATEIIEPQGVQEAQDEVATSAETGETGE
ncbi:hypothetical protein QB910_000101 [Dabrowskivirus KKP3916]|uniref:Uncharacterized protein n=1 Tax=Alicyclobacillus phage KKP_3916 TaxID=3040651 RepID=A0AAT9V7T2_9CAUD|nr:hypothetical protein QB910_000101 [Alicyclobacillus phage KKP 3916]